MPWGVVWFLLLVLPAVAGAGDAGNPTPPSPDPVNLWPFYDARYDPVERAVTQGGLGPLFASFRAVDGSVEQRAFRPFYHWRREVPLDREEVESLYPIVQYTRHEQDTQLQIFYAFDVRREGSIPEAREERLDLFPFYMSGRRETGETYHAVFPFGGKVYDRLGREELEFVLFPVYVRSVWRGAERRFFLWPLFEDIRGEGHTGFRLGPLYGEETREGVLESRFLFWPFIMSERRDLDTDNPQESRVAFPLVMAIRSPARDTTTVFWPLLTYKVDRERKFEEWQFPFPLFIIARGEGRHVNRFLPFFTEERYILRGLPLVKEMKVRNFAVLYPLYIRTEDETPASLVVRDRILWWLYSDARETGKEGDARRVDMWPFFRYVRNKEGWVTSQALALLEAFMPGNEVFERNWSPLWALYTYRRNPQGDEAHSVLWNLVRVETTREGRTVEVLGPLFAYREQGEESRLSLLAGLLAFERTPGVRAVRLFGQRILAWAEEPQRLAALASPGGDR
jgi:hypothetical protein